MDAQNNKIQKKKKSIFIKVFFKWRFAVAIATAILILFLFSCKKIVEDTQMDIAQQYFKNNILNSDFVIDSAYNNGIDVTARFAGFKIKLLEGADLASGPITAKKADSTINGTWLATEQYGKLTVNFISPPTGFDFFNRSWRFLEKNLPIMKLAPWGMPDPAVTRLYMRRF